MPYEGERIDHCPVTAFDFTNTYAVVVSGARWNTCGHQILNLGGLEGRYFHVAGYVYYEPLMMSEAGYRRYLEENHKKELSRYRVIITNPDAAMLRLEQLTSKKWRWLILPHNCASFVEEVVQAGGSSAGLYFNCPRFERFQ